MILLKKTPRPLRASIKRDPIHPKDYLYLKQAISCEDCSHFNSQGENCTLGYQSRYHRRDFQNNEYEKTGKVALCRFLEVD